MAAHVLWSNHRGGSELLAFPFLAELFPSLRGDPMALGDASAGLIALGGALSLALRLRRLRQAGEDEAPPST